MICRGTKSTACLKEAPGPQTATPGSAAGDAIVRPATTRPAMPRQKRLTHRHRSKTTACSLSAQPRRRRQPTQRPADATNAPDHCGARSHVFHRRTRPSGSARRRRRPPPPVPSAATVQTAAPVAAPPPAQISEQAAPVQAAAPPPAVPASPVAAATPPADGQLYLPVKAYFETKAVVTLKDFEDADRTALQQYYEAHMGQALWVTRSGFNAGRPIAAREFAKADDWGLAHDDYKAHGPHKDRRRRIPGR